MAPRTRAAKKTDGKNRKTAKATKASSSRRKHSARAVIEALRSTGGYTSHAARALGCSINTLKTYIAESQEIRAVYDEMNESAVESLEKTAYELAAQGNVSMLMFLLRTKGKHKGYAEARPVDIRTERDDAAKAVLKNLRNGELTAREAALDFESLGLPLPETVKFLLRAEPPIEQDPTNGEFSSISLDEIRARYTERKAAEAAQMADFVPERRIDVVALKQEFDRSATGKQAVTVQNVERNTHGEES